MDEEKLEECYEEIEKVNHLNEELVQLIEDKNDEISELEKIIDSL